MHARYEFDTIQHKLNLFRMRLFTHFITKSRFCLSGHRHMRKFLGARKFVETIEERRGYTIIYLAKRRNACRYSLSPCCAKAFEACSTRSVLRLLMTFPINFIFSTKLRAFCAREKPQTWAPMR